MTMNFLTTNYVKSMTIGLLINSLEEKKNKVFACFEGVSVS